MIAVQDLRFTYPGRKEEALRGLSFEVAPGEVFGFLGPSGAGKSTTQKIMIGLLRDYRGSVRVAGTEIRDRDSSFFEDVGVSFEIPTLYSRLTARENLRFFASLYSGATEDPDRLLEMVGLTEDADHRVAGFSKGMKMRLNLCRALVNRPHLLFLDEPTTGQDPASARRIKDLILELKDQGRTVFVNTHNMSVADEVCDRVAFIVEGSISVVDSPRTLKLRQGSRRVRLEYRKNGRLETRDFELSGIGACAEFLALIREREIETIHTQEASLEDVFIAVTGRSLS